MSYRVEMTASSEHDLASLPKQVQARLRPVLFALRDNPRPHGSQKMSGFQNIYRLGVGDYRIVYAVRDKALLVLVVAVGERQNMYGLKLVRRIRKSVSDWEGG